MLRLDFAPTVALNCQRRVMPMISDEVARDGLAALGVAAVMLIEDAAEELTTVATDARAGRRVAAALTALGTDISALAAAAAVFARHRDRGDAAPPTA